MTTARLAIDPSRRLLLAAVVAITAAVLHSSYAFDGVAFFDEGVLVDGAWRVRHGAIPGIDGWMPYGPAGYWVIAPFLAWCGESLVTVRAVLVGMEALSAGALCWLLLGTASVPGALLATALVVIAPGALHKATLALAVAVALLAARQLARHSADQLAHTSRATGAFQAGLLAAVAFLFRHDVGGFAAAACGIALLLDGSLRFRDRCRSALVLSSGFLAVLVPVTLALVVAGLDLPQWWAHEWQRITVQERIDVAIGMPLEIGATVGEPFGERGGELHGGRAALWSAFIAAPLLLLGWGVAAWRRLARGAALPFDRMRVAAALFGLLLLNQARLVPSTHRLFQSLAPIAFAAGDLLARRGRGVRSHTVLALVVLAVMVWAAMGRIGVYSGTIRRPIDGGVELALATGRIRLRPAFAHALERVVASIQRRVGPDEPLATSPGSPLLGFLSQRRLALPYAEPSYYYGDPRFQREAIAAFEQARAPLLVVDGGEPANYRFETAAPLVAKWLAERYRPIEQIGNFTLLERWP